MEQVNHGTALLRQWAASYTPARGRMAQKANAAGKAGGYAHLRPLCIGKYSQ